MSFRCRLLWPVSFSILSTALLIIPPVHAQTPASAPPQETANPAVAFKTTVRTVVVDVVVTDKKDQTVPGLKKEDFQVLDDGKPQSIAFFEEHAGINAPAKLAPGVFTNYPLSKQADAVNVLLLDSLNTPMSDQAYLRANMIKYLDGIQPGTRLAIFTLALRLRFVLGFTTDPKVVTAALESKKMQATPQLSAILPTAGEIYGQQQQLAQMNSVKDPNLPGEVVPPSIAAAALALQSFQQENADSQTNYRVCTTLEAMRQLARYLSGIPGRKNVLWFSSSFPLTIFSDASDSLPCADSFRKTANILAAAQVAIYPIGAEGVAGDSIADTSALAKNVTSARDATKYQINTLNQDSVNRNSNHSTMDELARDTGGEAYYNTNGISDAIARVINHGSRYYTLAYTPSEKASDGQFRSIKVKLASGDYKLSYRRGYYASDAKADEKEAKAQAAASPTNDPLRPLMDHGTPDSTQIVYKMRVQTTVPQPAAGAPPAGDNPKLAGSAIRYTASFTIDATNLRLDPVADGARHGIIEMALLAYDRDGKPLNWFVRTLELNMPAQRYAAVMAGGIQLHFDFDIPKEAVYLRTGVYDPGSTNAGTLELPISSIAIALTAAPK